MKIRLVHHWCTKMQRLRLMEFKLFRSDNMNAIQLKLRA